MWRGRQGVVVGLVLVFLLALGSPARSWHGVGGFCNFVGGNDGNNYLAGTIYCDHQEGYGGHDVLHGEQNKDGQHGGAGDDQIHGEDDRDPLYGQSGADYLNGGPGEDTCVHGGDPGDLKVNCEH